MIQPPCFRAHVAFDDLHCGQQTGVILATLPLLRNDPNAAAVLLDQYPADVVWIVPLIELERITRPSISRTTLPPIPPSETDLPGNVVTILDNE